MLLEVRDLAVGHAGVALQRGLSFDLEAKRRLAIVGPSGCGKTTLLRALATLDAPLEGTLRLEGRAPEVVGFPAWRRRVVYVAQRATFFGGTVEAELARPFGYRAARGRFDRDAARQALARVGLGDRLDAEAGHLSEGERQRLALVRAGLLAPDVLLLDEPTSALDAATAAAVEAWLAGADAAVILVTHDAAQASRLATDTLALEVPDGR